MFFLSFLFHVTVVQTLATNIDPSQNLNDLPNNSLFTQWRPNFHFLAPSGWINDPNGALYDPATDQYHLFYQFHPNHVDWGNISWGSALSKDLVTWTDVGGWQDDQPQAIGTGPNGSYDFLGIFSGTAQPYNLNGQQDGNLTVFYTSVNDLPINQNAESQSLATSSDGGLSWQKFSGNPVIPAPPDGWTVTGWRDPFFLPWPELDTILGQTEPHYYVVFGVGIVNVGPRAPLYSAPASDLTKWTFLGPLLDLPGDFIWGGDASKQGSFGWNFECPGVFSLLEKEENGGDGVTKHNFINVATQGGAIRSWSLWAEGDITKKADGSAQLGILSSGVIDWGNLYAITSFWDAKNERQVVWGWSGEDMNGYGIKAQGFQGSMAIPREWFVSKLHGIVAPSAGPPTNSSETWTADGNGTYTVTTLGTRPLPDVVAALHPAPPATTVDDASSDHFHLKATLNNINGEAGFVVRASPGREEFTTISYSATTNTVSVNRNSSSLIKQFSTGTASGYFLPYTTAQGPENIALDIFVDGSLVEVYINDRFALTTRIYPSRDDALGISQYVGTDSFATFSQIQFWSELINVWPERPANSSSQLIQDTAEQTNNGQWWSGN